MSLFQRGLPYFKTANLFTITYFTFLQITFHLIKYYVFCLLIACLSYKKECYKKKGIFSLALLLKQGSRMFCQRVGTAIVVLQPLTESWELVFMFCYSELNSASLRFLPFSPLNQSWPWSLTLILESRMAKDSRTGKCTELPISTRNLNISHS